MELTDESWSAVRNTQVAQVFVVTLHTQIH